MKLSKTVVFLVWMLGFTWLFIQFGGFLQERVVIGADLLFWVLWASLVLNVGLAAYLFDLRRNNGRGNPPPLPPQP